MTTRRTVKTGYVAFVVPIVPADGDGFRTVVHRRADDGELVIRSPRGGWFSVDEVRNAGFAVLLKPSEGVADEMRAADEMTDSTLAALYRLSALADPSNRDLEQKASEPE